MYIKSSQQIFIGHLQYILCWYGITYNTYRILLILRHTLVHILTSLKPTCSWQLLVCGRLIVIAFVVIIDISLAYYETYFLFTLCRAVGWLWLHWPLLWLVWLGLAYLCTATYVVLESRWEDQPLSGTILPLSHGWGKEQKLNLTSQAHLKLPGYGLCHVYSHSVGQSKSHGQSWQWSRGSVLHPPWGWEGAVGTEE